MDTREPPAAAIEPPTAAIEPATAAIEPATAAIEPATAAREPEWFCPRTFSKEVLNYSFREYGVIPLETRNSFLQLPETFRDAVEKVGRAVFTIQVMIHKRLMVLVAEGLQGVEWRGVNGLTEFMCQGYLQCDSFNTAFSVLAIIAEIILFLREKRFPVPDDFHYRPFCRIYEYSLRDGLLSQGGIERLVEAADTRYVLSGLYAEKSNDYRIYNTYPNARMHGENLPVNVLRVIDQANRVAPPDTDLALSILREIYLEHGVVPLNPPEN